MCVYVCVFAYVERIIAYWLTLEYFGNTSILFFSKYYSLGQKKTLNELAVFQIPYLFWVFSFKWMWRQAFEEMKHNTKHPGSGILHFILLVFEENTTLFVGVGHFFLSFFLFLKVIIKPRNTLNASLGSSLKYHWGYTEFFRRRKKEKEGKKKTKEAPVNAQIV